MSVADIATVDELLAQAKTKYAEVFKETPTVAGLAPGRVNIIGEHTDYNDGFVFPMALPLYTVVVGALSPDGEGNTIRVLTTNEGADAPRLVEFPVPTTDAPLKPSKEPAWANYFKGVVAKFHGPVRGFKAVIVSSVPLGGGLSSSASLEVASYTFLEALLNSPAASPRAKALCCQKAEHEFAGVPCGIMDQFVTSMAQEGQALLIDCRSLVCEQIPISDPELSVVIINSNVRHSLAGSEYAARRDDCFAAAKAMGKDSLRDATLDDILGKQWPLSEVQVKRASHVVTEIARTLQAVVALKEKNYTRFGELMTQSHHSLRNEYEVSCPELDELVGLAVAVPGVLGSRMTGGGFGGCTVTLVRQDSVAALLTHVAERYSGTPTFYMATASRGAYSVTL
uniref:Galactokinase-like n=2 Tax=Hirondellea gigas TaxID=1518452 RepID=A0A6A7G4H3_9CRUS